MVAAERREREHIVNFIMWRRSYLQVRYCSSDLLFGVRSLLLVPVSSTPENLSGLLAPLPSLAFFGILNDGSTFLGGGAGCLATCLGKKEVASSRLGALPGAPGAASLASAVGEISSPSEGRGSSMLADSMSLIGHIEYKFASEDLRSLHFEEPYYVRQSRTTSFQDLAHCLISRKTLPYRVTRGRPAPRRPNILHTRPSPGAHTHLSRGEFMWAVSRHIVGATARGMGLPGLSERD